MSTRMSFANNLLIKKTPESISIKQLVDATISGEIHGINFKPRIEEIRSLSNPWSNAKDTIKKIKLEIVGLSFSQTQSGAYALVLGEEVGQRFLE